jgi:dynactin complex subunit
MTDEPVNEFAAKFSEALLDPLAQVGALLAHAIDDLTDEVGRLRAQLNTLDAAYEAHLHAMHGIRKS